MCLLINLLAQRSDLVLQPHKCRVLIPSDSAQAIATVRALATPHGMTVHAGSMALHGGCVGSDELLMQELLNDKVDKHGKLLEIISDPKMSSPIAFHIIRQCIVGSLAFYMRITPPECAVQCLQRFDDMVEQAIIKTHSLPSLEPMQQLLLPLVGIPKSSVTAVAAYFACVAACLPVLPILESNGVLERHFRTTHATLITEFPDGALSPRIPTDFSNVIQKFSNIDPTVSEASKLQRFIMQKIKSVFMSNLESG